MVSTKTTSVRQWMTADPVTVTPETTVPDAALIMRQGGFRRLPVMEDGKLVGIVTDRDLKEAMPSDATSLSIWEINYLVAKLPVREVMSYPVISIDESATLEQAAKTMLENKLGGLPVVSGEKLVGIVTVSDVLRAFVHPGAN
ncbi:Inosine-5'-monophosphate dehydrogenase [Calidithermus terrae]|uniref:Inosine-5'-monophosphate dehydrogenase n=1 Tax=Calidithermus terrae TaxID=1408545 RepID=A0A399EDS7_9DEIN|nr:CBS domain-containing protein [Calidithermus terrae]RIH82485.1 Inosine-5'-monophosphate dehydrogenase [Calidithermus terrae]